MYDCCVLVSADYELKSQFFFLILTYLRPKSVSDTSYMLKYIS